MSEDTFNKNMKKMVRSTYNIGDLPDDVPSFPNKWQIIMVDAHLTLFKHFKRKYHIEGERARVQNFFDQIGVEKSIRISSIHSPFKVIRKPVISAKFKNPERRARFFQYKNKFFPFDREDLHIVTVDAISGEKLLGPCLVVDLSSSTREDFGHPIGDNARQERVFTYLQVPEGEKLKEPEVDLDKDDLTPKQIDLFNNPPDEESVDIGFKTPEETQASIKSLQQVDSQAHKIRATILMINRAKATLKNTTDRKKKKNILSSLKKWQQYKRKLKQGQP